MNNLTNNYLLVFLTKREIFIFFDFQTNYLYFFIILFFEISISLI